jgi:nitrate reductase delta subunit
MKAPEAAEPNYRGALSAAAEWRLLGLLFERPRPGWREAVEAIAHEVSDEELRTAAAEAREADEGAYLRVLGPGGAVAAREAGYQTTGELGRVLSDVAAFYEAFSFRPAAEDPIDHVAVEAGFAGYLRLKEAYALARGDAENAGTAARALDRFIEAHLRFMAGPLARRLAAAGPSYLKRAAASLVARAGDAPDPAWGIAASDASAPTGEAGLCCGGMVPEPEG